MNTNFEQFATIKTEPDIGEEPMTVNDGMPVLNENSRGILMDFGMNRKKVIHLDGSNSLLTECKNHVYSDPTLSELLSHSYPVFQEFTPKFNTWVDIDCESTLRDGTVVKVVFFPKVVETDGLNPGSIKRKRYNVDNEANPKQYRILGDNVRRKSNLLNRCDENIRNDVENEVIYVYSTEGSDISPSIVTQRSDGKPVHQAATPSPVAKKEQRSLLRETIKAHVPVTSTNAQTENLKEIESADILPDFHHLPSSTVGQATGVVLSEQQILREKIPPIRFLNEEHLKKKKNKKVTPARFQPFLDKEKSPPTCPGNSAPGPDVSQRSISWSCNFSTLAAGKRLHWGQKNKGKEWRKTVFSHAAMFSLEGNRIKYFDKMNPTKKECVIFWGFRTFHGPNIIVHLSSFEFSEMVSVLKKNVFRTIMDYYKSSDVTIQYQGTFKPQFDSKVMKMCMKGTFTDCMLPRCARDLSPVYQAWKLIGEKIKNIPCLSKQEMISIVTRLWERDIDVEVLCSEVISLLPQIIESVIQQNGQAPEVNVRYFVTT